jgi:hypothetical protein
MKHVKENEIIPEFLYTAYKVPNLQRLIAVS